MREQIIDILKIGIVLTAGLSQCETAIAETGPQAGQEREATSMSGQPDFMNLKNIPVEQVMRLARNDARKFDDPNPFDDPKEARENVKNFERETALELENLPRARRQLATLLLVDDLMGNSNLAGFFWRPAANFAPQILEVLVELDFQPQARVFAEAMAQFGKDYPVDYWVRDRLSPMRKAMQDYWIVRRKKGLTEEQVVEELDRMAQPDDLQNKLLDLSDAFHDRGGFDRAIGAFISKTPELVAWADEIRPTISEKARFYWLAEQLQPSAMTEMEMRQQVLSWPKPYRQTYVLSWFNGETLNGGIHQFFFNSSGLFAPEVVEALRDIGLPRMADAVQEGIDLFPKPYPVSTDERRAFLANFLDPASKTGERDDKLYALDDRIYDTSTIVDNDNGPLLQAMIAYAKRENILPK